MKLIPFKFQDWVPSDDGGMRDPVTDVVTHVVVLNAVNDRPMATVFYGGFPVLTVCVNPKGDDYAHECPVRTERWAEMMKAAFLMSIGELRSKDDQDRLLLPFVQEHGIIEAFEYFGGQVYSFIEFVGVVYNALHAAYPDTTPEVKGF